MKEYVRLAAIIAVATILGVNLANTFRPLLFLWGGPPDFVSLSEERLRILRTTAPKTGEVGYVGDGNPGGALTAPEAVKKYYLMQYALTPLVVIPTMDKPVIIGDFNGSMNAVVQESYTVRRLGQGIVIIEQKSK